MHGTHMASARPERIVRSQHPRRRRWGRIHWMRSARFGVFVVILAAVAPLPAPAGAAPAPTGTHGSGATDEVDDQDDQQDDHEDSDDANLHAITLSSRMRVETTGWVGRSATQRSTSTGPRLDEPSGRGRLRSNGS